MQSLLKSGRIYSFQSYANAKKDTQPLVLIFGTGTLYSEGLNIHYLSGWEQKLLAEAIVKLHFNFKDMGYSGMLLYKLLLIEMPYIVKKSYRKYFLRYITGSFLVSNGVSNPDGADYGETVLKHPYQFTVYLNNLLKPNSLLEIRKKLAKNMQIARNATK